jgi:hypothetical protein
MERLKRLAVFALTCGTLVTVGWLCETFFFFWGRWPVVRCEWVNAVTAG